MTRLVETFIICFIFTNTGTTEFSGTIVQVLVELWDMNILWMQTIKFCWFDGKRDSVKLKLQNKATDIN